MFDRRNLQITSLAIGCCVFLLTGTAEAATKVIPDMTPTKAQIAVARRALPSYYKMDPQLTFTLGFADLNGDGRPDMILQTTDRGFCGASACQGFAVLAVPGGYSHHAIRLALFTQSVTVFKSIHHGMHDLTYDNAKHTFRWSGTQYR